MVIRTETQILRVSFRDPKAAARRTNDARDACKREREKERPSSRRRHVATGDEIPRTLPGYLREKISAWLRWLSGDNRELEGDD